MDRIAYPRARKRHESLTPRYEKSQKRFPLIDLTNFEEKQELLDIIQQKREFLDDVIMKVSNFHPFVNFFLFLLISNPFLERFIPKLN